MKTTTGIISANSGGSARDARHNRTGKSKIQLAGQCEMQHRVTRHHELTNFSKLHLAGLIIDYGVLLTEDCDPIEAIIDYEMGQCE